MSLQKIPLFPLGLVAFPGEKLNLHIFEPRYKQLIIDAEKENFEFGIVPVVNRKPINVGTSVRLKSIEHIYPDGKMDIKTIGTRVFKLRDFYGKMEKKLYPGGEVEFIPEEISAVDIILKSKIVEQVQSLYKMMNVVLKGDEFWQFDSIFEIAHKVGMNMQQEIQLLKIDNENDRLEFVGMHLDELMPVVSQAEEMKRKVEMNGHFKNIIPPDLKL